MAIEREDAVFVVKKLKSSLPVTCGASLDAL